MKLYETTKIPDYLTWSHNMTDWLLNSEMISEQNLIHDGINVVNGKCSTLSPNYYSYNQGIFLPTLSKLSKITGDGKYIGFAMKILEAIVE
jgi:predicted alpha-1,6-mannanase (GH76 family)